jgi:hypothetical protein
MNDELENIWKEALINQAPPQYNSIIAVRYIL